MNEQLAKLRLWWAERNKREQLMVAVFVVCAGLYLVYFVAIRPVTNGHDRWDSEIIDRGDDLFELVQLERKKIANAGSQRASGRRLGNVSPIQFLEQIATRVGVKDRIRNIRPGATDRQGNARYTLVTFQIDELTMREMTDLLYQIEIQSGYDLSMTRFKADRKEYKDKTRVNISAEIRIRL